MGRKKKEEEPVIPNEYGVTWNGEFIKSVFSPHKKTKTEKMVRLASATVIMAQMTRWLQRNNAQWMKNRQIEYQNGIRTLTFANPFAAKLWLVMHSSYPGGKDNAFFFTEADLDRIITKHKYEFRRGFQLDDEYSRPLLCEFEIQKINGEN